MDIKNYKEYSNIMGKEMEYKVYGDSGIVCLVMPSENGFMDYEKYGMIDAAKRYIDSGCIRFVCCDGNYQDTWQMECGEPQDKIEKHEQWVCYLLEELIPQINPQQDCMMITGCGIGGFIAFSLFIRRPDIFQKVLTHSAMFHAGYYLGDYEDELTLINSPIDYLLKADIDESKLNYYRNADIMLCCGQGYWELDSVKDHQCLERILADLGIDAWIDLWGYDVSRDCCWWRKQLEYALQFM